MTEKLREALERAILEWWAAEAPLTDVSQQHCIDTLVPRLESVFREQAAEIERLQNDKKVLAERAAGLVCERDEAFARKRIAEQQSRDKSQAYDEISHAYDDQLSEVAELRKLLAKVNLLWKPKGTGDPLNESLERDIDAALEGK